MSSRLIQRQQRSFDALVESGIYDADFDHAPSAKAFVAQVLADIAPKLRNLSSIKILDCGCGTGAWLSFIHAELAKSMPQPKRLCGFDLSSRMVEVGREKLGTLAAPEDLQQGNLLDKGCFAFQGTEAGFDLIFTYDVVQQLPRHQQFDACRMIVDHLAQGGIALIFDNDCDTKFGRKMALRKFMTRYFRMGLVPDYYCNASYPPLSKFQKIFESQSVSKTHIVVRPDEIKRALIVERQMDLAAPRRSQPG